MARSSGEGIETVIVGKPNAGKSSPVKPSCKQKEENKAIEMRKKSLKLKLYCTKRYSEMEVARKYPHSDPSWNYPGKIVDTAGIRETEEGMWWRKSVFPGHEN